GGRGRRRTHGGRETCDGRRWRGHGRGAECRRCCRTVNLRFDRRWRFPRMDGRQGLARRRSVEDKVGDLTLPDFPGIRNTDQEMAMKLEELHKIAEAMVTPGKGILAADES